MLLNIFSSGLQNIIIYFYIGCTIYSTYLSSIENTCTRGTVIINFPFFYTENFWLNLKKTCSTFLFTLSLEHLDYFHILKNNLVFSSHYKQTHMVEILKTIETDSHRTSVWQNIPEINK